MKTFLPPRLRLLALLSLMLLSSLPTLAVDFTYTYEGKTITYTVISESAKTCKTKEGKYGAGKNYAGNDVTGDLILPESPNGYKLIEIGKYAFSGCSGLTSLTIPNSVTSIGNWAFSGCTGLQKAEFASIEALCNIKFGDKWSNPLLYAPHLYIGGKEITEVNIPNSVTSIGDYAFSGCSGLTSVTIPNSVTSIGEYAFEDCTGLTSVTIPNSVTRIRSYTFYGCSGLTSIEIPNSVTSIGKWAFSGCTGLQKAEFASIEALCNIYFYDYSSNPLYYANHLYIGGKEITEVTIPNSVTRIRSYTFYGCSGLTSIEIPNSVTSIGDWAFRDCSGLTSVTIPNSVTSIGEDAFYGCSGLNSVTIGNSVTSIGEGVFVLCTGLSSIEIPNSVTSIGNDAFWKCSGLTSVTLPNSVTSMGSGVFYGCKATIIVPASVFPILKQETWSNFTGKIVFRDIKYTYAHKTNVSNIQITLEDNPYYDQNYTPAELSAEIYKGNTLVSSTPLNKKGTFTIDGLDWLTKYQLRIMAKTDDEKDYKIYTYNFSLGFSFKTNVSITQTTATLTFSDMSPDDESFTLKEFGIYWNGSKERTPVKDKFVMKNLNPGADYSYRPYVIYDDNEEYIFDKKSLATTGWECNFTNTQQAPTTAVLKATFKEGDAKAEKVWWEFDGQKVDGTSVTLVSLKPDSSYSANFCISYNGKTYRNSASFSTTKLELETLTPKCVSSSCAIVAAKTNISDWEPMAGFEWKKYDAPASMAPNKGYGAVCEGVLEGYIKNLQSTSYYNVRPFYQDAQGNFYYGEWVTFDPSDFSYFEPTVHTYPVQEVTTSTAKVRGYALSGTDNIISQGFQYWSSGAASARYFAPSASEITTVPASGQVMTATFENLKENTTYVYRAYVETEAGFTYGEEMTFTTESTSGIAENWYEDTENEAPTIVGYYDLQGRRYNTPQPGLNIVLYSDGTTRKIMAKR